MANHINITVILLLLAVAVQGQELVVKEKDGLYGFFEKDTMVVDFQFDSVNLQYNRYYTVRKAGKWGLISPDGRAAIQCKYDLLESSYNPLYIASYNGMMGVMDSTGNVVLDFLFDKIDHVDEDTLALVKYQGNWCWYKNGVYIYDDEFIFHRPDTLPLFPGCQKETDSYKELRSCANETMYLYIFNHLNYPSEARRKGIQGQVIVQFKVTSKGVIQDPVIRRGLGGGCNEEVLRMVNGMPNWIPAVQDGKNVALKAFTLPIKFVLR